MDVYKKIFGKTYRFRFSERNAHLIHGAIGLYPDVTNKIPDVSIKLVDHIESIDCISENPAIFTKCRDAIISKFSSCTVKWIKKTSIPSLEIEVAIPPQQSGGKAFLAKFMSIEFSTEIEAFEQILHELVLVPSVYFFNDLSIVHSAALAINGEAILLAGTGGTGKTSAMLALRKNDQVSFITDDIAIISKDGKVFPNLAWPKVYGYNLSSYITKSELMKGRGGWDRIQFNYRLKRNPKKVRRKVRPDKLYKCFENDGVPIKKIVYLFRDQSERMSVTPLNQELAIEMGIHIMKTEYSSFHNYLSWDAYNSLLTGEAPALNLQEVFKSWRLNLSMALKGKDTCTLHIPRGTQHEVYLDFMNKFIVSDE